MTTITFTSPLACEIDRFLQYKRTAGCKYLREESELRHLDRFLRSYPARNPFITLDVVRAYVIDGGPHSESTRLNRLCLIRQLCRFLAAENPRHTIPPERFLGIYRRPYLQRVLTRAEGKQFLAACLRFRTLPRLPMRSMVHGTAIMLLYLAGLRRGEVLHLTIGDVDLAKRLLCVRETKFGKSRLVPITSDVARRLCECSRCVQRHLGTRPRNAPFFPGPRGKPIGKTVLGRSFQRILLSSGIMCEGAAGRPRLHDLRGTFAVHRLLLWYEQGADLDAKLPLLSTYLGHVGLEGTQKYLQLTRDLVGEVTRRHQAHFGHLITDLEGRRP